jgi:hypothetical protein
LIGRVTVCHKISVDRVLESVRPAARWRHSSAIAFLAGSCARSRVRVGAAGGDAIDIGLARVAPICKCGFDDLPASSVAGNRDGPELVGPHERNSSPVQQADRLGVGMTIRVIGTDAGDRQFRADQSQPARVGTVAATVVGELEDRAVGGQVRVIS